MCGCLLYEYCIDLTNCLTPGIAAPKPECTVDPDCPAHLACLGQKCRDPCVPEQCGQRAICRVNSHRAVCLCPPPLEGNPYIACIEREYHKMHFGTRLGAGVTKCQ